MTWYGSEILSHAPVIPDNALMAEIARSQVRPSLEGREISERDSLIRCAAAAFARREPAYKFSIIALAKPLVESFWTPVTPSSFINLSKS